ncbi:MAG: serine hydrolase [Gammaproteobacteria bacterium]|nr:serine hydrolase [Gammaproteobacteria bacterium]MYL01507.1 serine hydrolase [Gammaproteobacteria bacterium]
MGTATGIHLVLFDIDGTLVDSDEFDSELYVQAVREILGIEIGDDWSAYRNVTDGGILDEIIDNAGLTDGRLRIHAEVKAVFAGLVSDYLDEREGRLPEIEGAGAFMTALESLPEVSMALATGGWEVTARMKLRAAGLDRYSLPLASGSDALTRVEIMQIAEKRALGGRAADRRTYFGDGVWDKQASEKLGYDFIAIGDKVQHHARYPDFRRGRAILSRLLGAVALFCCAAAFAGLAQAQTIEGFFPGRLMFSPEEEALYMQRYEKAQVRRTAEEIYVDQEAMVGADDWAPLPAAAPAERTILAQALDDAERYAEINNSNAFIVWRKGKIERETYFGGHTRTSPINSFSLAKQVTAFAIGRALMLGNIASLDQPVADFVTEWQGDPWREKILVRHLLDMRAGFFPQVPPQGPTDLISRTFLHPRHDEIIVAEYPVIDEPGTRYEYNNAAGDMVAVLIERATSRRYAEFVSMEIWRKIGALGGAVWVNRPGGTAHSGCCMLAPAENFLRLAISLLRDGVWEGERLLPEGYVREMITPTRENPYFGLSIWVAGRYTERRGFANPDRGMAEILHGEPYLAADLYLFDGNANQVIYVVPSQDLVILRTGLAPPRDENTEWDNSVLPNIVMRGIMKDRRASAPQPH